ncbi:MAG: hypothetical protein LBH81_02150 [Rickettsiales bacterium]|jgi:hypothetical protein|nr:hypothetical protein [Rickettsiales bacterium]
MKMPTIDMLYRYYAEAAAWRDLYNQRFSVEKATERQIVRSANAQGIKCESAEDIAELRARSMEVYNAMLRDAKKLAASKSVSYPDLESIRPLKSAGEFNCVIFDDLMRMIERLKYEIAAAPVWHSFFNAAMADKAQGGSDNMQRHMNHYGSQVKKWMTNSR